MKLAGTHISNDLFAFEVPTPKGIVRVIAPEDLTRDEAKAAARVIFDVLPLAVTGDDVQETDRETE